MIDNRSLLDQLLDCEEIRLARGPFLREAPPAFPCPVDWDRVEGMMLGLAIGDALGNTSESQQPSVRRARHGEIRDYLPNSHASYRPLGLPSDDSQLAFWTLEQLLADDGLVPDHLAERFARERVFGIGSAVRSSLSTYKSGGHPWYRCGDHSAGNGALMRIAPVLVPHLQPHTAALWADTILAASVTHNDATSTSACVAWVYMLWSLLGMETPPEPRWWPDTYVVVAAALEGEARLKPRGGSLNYHGPLWRLVSEHVATSYEERCSVLEACDKWYSGAYLLETVPSALYILMCYAADPEAAIVRAVNDTRDNDTIAAIVGAAVGALHGRRRLPERWLTGLLGRTGADDDGRVFELLDQARHAFGPAS